ncbi:MAG: VgrG-related protein [Chloroflexi bacterium]|nr:VgrG-related protein [Chloroflexota bacterium]
MPDDRAIDVALVVSGMELRPELLAHVEQAVVDEDLYRPAMFAITLADPNHDIVGRTGLRPGVEVEISVVGPAAADDRPLLTGDVVTIECDYDELGARVVARGYAATHRLHRGRRTRVFRDVTDSDIVKQVADEARLTVGRIESTSEVHDHVSQANVSDWDFLADRARRVGLDLTIVDGELRFGQRATSADAPPEASPDVSRPPTHLTFGYNLESFHGRVSAAAQVGDVEVRGWDEDRKAAVVATSGAGTGAATLATASPTELAGFFRSPTFVEVNAPVHGEREAGDTAKAIAERIGSAFAEAEGSAHGSTALRAGVAVRVSRVSDDFSGAYVLTRVRHVLNRRGYVSHFTVSGRHDRSLLGLLGANGNGNGAAHGDGLAGRAAPGVVRGLVSDNRDPEKLGRVKVRFPWLDEDYSSTWAPVMQLGAGPDSGTFFLPAVGDEVLVGFEHGRVDRPVVIGGLFNKTDKPPGYADFLDDGAVTGRGIWSRTGHRISLHDGNDAAGIILRAVDGQGGSVVSIGLNATDEKLVVWSEGDIAVEALGDITLKGANVTVQADRDLVLKGATIKLN